MTVPAVPVVRLGPATPADFEELLGVRISAMRDSLEQIGRFDAARARERFRATFNAADTRHIYVDDRMVGFVAASLRQDEHSGRHLHLQHLYIRPGQQGGGIGAAVLTILFGEADTLQVQIRVAALRGSDANRFYQRHGFQLTGEEEWDIYYVRYPASAVSGSRATADG
jgi:GNAT superfamily N-acetyltransferase